MKNKSARESLHQLEYCPCTLNQVLILTLRAWKGSTPNGNKTHIKFSESYLIRFVLLKREAQAQNEVMLMSHISKPRFNT